MAGKITWQTISRPGQTGKNKTKIYTERDQLYGEGNWRQAWEFDGRIYTKPAVFKICEEAYYEYALNNRDQWLKLLALAKDVYDYSKDEVASGCDYSKQLHYTRFHDICIRNVVKRMGWEFTGTKLVQIRWDANNPKPFLDQFDPGQVAFHKPELITKPSLKGFWKENTVEDFYQSNKVLQIKK